MRIISLNLNGLRSAADKGVMDWLSAQSADVVCLQELKAQPSDLSERHLSFPTDRGAAQSWLHCAQKRGYSGVGLYSSHQPVRVETGFGVPEFDDEGRLVRADFSAGTLCEMPLSVMSLYAPSGSASEERQASKFRFMEAFRPCLEQWMQDHLDTGREYMICGDWNIAHTNRDLKNWKGNQKNSGFLPEERAWISDILDRMGWVDGFRHLYPEEQERGYTWWSNRGQARAKNVGWRIDYALITPGLASRLRAATVYKDQRFSDHAPLVLDFLATTTGTGLS
ncbi:XthA Exonuclease III [Burkholderiales bacterium]